MATELGPVLIPQAPRVANDLPEYVRNVEVYARQIEQTFRQFERWAKGLQAEAALKTDIELLNPVTTTVTGQTITTVVQGPPGAPGSPGQPGVNGANGTTWTFGSGAPSNGVGVDGDSYFRTDTGDVYAKAGGVYTVQGNLTGPQGPQGASGTSGPVRGARAWASANTSLVSGADTAVSFGTEQFDSDTMFDPGSPLKLTCVTAGYYLIQAQATFDGAVAGLRRIGIVVGASAGGSRVAQQAHRIQSDGTALRCGASGVYYLNAAEFVEVFAFQDSGTTLNVLAGIDNTWFSAVRVGA